MKKGNWYTVCLLISLINTSVLAADISKGKTKAAMCAGCHGSDGMGLSEEFPNLAGQHQAYLVKQLKAFKSGSRKNPSMQAMVSSLNDEDIQNLAAYFSSLTAAKAVSAVEPVKALEKAGKKEFPDTTYITMKKSATVQTFPKQITWKGGPNMLYDALTPNGKMLLATSPSDNTVYVFDTANGKQLAVIPVGKAPKGVKVTPDGNYAATAAIGDDFISVINTETLAVTNIKVGNEPHGIRASKDSQWIYVTLTKDNTVAVVNTRTMTVEKKIAVGKFPFWVAVQGNP